MRRRWYGIAAVWLGLQTVACAPGLTDAICQRSQVCEQKGRCRANANECVAVAEEDCRNSRFCYDLGLCSLAKEAGVCVALQEADCRASSECKTDRRCIPSNGACVEITPGWCRRKVDDDGTPTTCQTHGVCGFDAINQSCLAKSEKDCIASDRCLALGDCSLLSGRCVVQTDRDCRQSKLCADEGRCHAAPPLRSTDAENSRECVALSQQDCLQDCKDRQVGCIFDPVLRGCTAGPAFCKASDACRVSGLCSWDKASARCTIASDADCKQSQLCSDAGRCLHHNGQCVHDIPDDCESSPACLEEGKCASRDGACVPAVESDCRGSQQCREVGLCGFVKDRCVAASEDDCIDSDACYSEGLCTLDADKGVCIIGGPLDCENSDSCILDGRCLYKECTQADVDGGRKCKVGDGICVEER